MQLKSAAFHHGGKIPARHTCDGDNLSPPLELSEVPASARSLALIMDDHDVPPEVCADGVWDHWIVFNIPPHVTEMAEGQEPDGRHGLGTGGNLAYSGPCPPDREHRYFLRVYALDTELDLPERASKHQVLEAMEGHILASAKLMGRYERHPH